VVGTGPGTAELIGESPARFQYTVCTTYYLSKWTGPGYIFNNQSTGTVTYLYKLNNAVYVKDVAKDPTNREVNWDPVWSIRVC
jgi:hypothetical protein